MMSDQERKDLYELFIEIYEMEEDGGYDHLPEEVQSYKEMIEFVNNN